jgi:predicted dehydrogenase
MTGPAMTGPAMTGPAMTGPAMTGPAIRIGILGTARIAPTAVIGPARHQAGVTVAAVASRHPEKAARFARDHDIPNAASTYQALVDDDDIDAIYNPLPNGLHAEWTLKALEAGKHVLCEKPFTANAAEADRVATAAGRTGVVVMEAFHYRYHPLVHRAVEIARSGELGTVRRVDTAICFPLPRFSDIRYQLDLAGGATMDVGCYAIHLARLLADDEPIVLAARAKLRPGRGQNRQVDRAMTTEVRYPAGHVGRITCSLWSSSLLRMSARVWGDAGRLVLINPLSPHVWHRLAVFADGYRRVEHFPRRATYDYQLEAFRAAVADGTPTLTPPADSVANMRVIDAVYRAAGLRPRGEGA